ncbi:MAG TPA: hypothetical protein DCS66_03010 [Flavobacteriaceae bacterium]|nr:hypothetical protein [Flavobacteriaceae bacterium]HAT63558.1 hypothetical protein [Flavobacteriaceae bacterium]|tara:strand:- start:37096 stop:38616 length:1521 start_codon:yes stop_codon:yes gene_type:complete
MNKIIILFLTLLFGHFLFAQENSLLINKTTENIENSYAESLLFANEDSSGNLFTVQKIFSNSSTPKGYYIKRFSNNLVLDERVKIDLESNEIRGMFLNEKMIYLIQFEYSREEKSYNINVLSSQKDSFNFKKSKLYSIEREDIDKYDKFGDKEKSFYPNEEEFNPGGVLVSSENGNYICYSIRLKRNKIAKNLFLLFDNNFNLLFTKIFEDETKGNVLVTKVTITNSGIIYFLNRKYEKDTPVSKIITSKNNYTIRLHSLRNDTFKEIYFNNQEFDGGSAFITNSGNKIFVYGYFTEEKNRMFNSAGFAGVFLSLFDTKNSDNINFKKYYFKDYLLNKKGNPIEEIGRELSFKNTFLESGNLIFNSEVNYTDGNNNACINYGSVLSTKFDENGELTWIKSINKKQSSCWGWSETYKYSFINLYVLNKIHYLINYDIQKNENINNNSLCNVITFDTNKDSLNQFSLPKNIVTEIFFKNYINLSNQIVLTEGIDFDGRPILIKISTKN